MDLRGDPRVRAKVITDDEEEFLYQLVVGIFGKFLNRHLVQSKFCLLIGKSVGYNRNFDFCPSCQSNLFLVTWFM